MPIDAAAVATYLQQNPQFFEEYADLLAEIFIPHPHGGRAIPIAERQILTLREKNKMLEGKLAELIQFGEENDQIGDKVHKLSAALLQTTDLSGVVGTLQYHLQEHFHVPHVALRLWLDGLDSSLIECSDVSSEVRSLADSLVTAPYCGPYVTDEVINWMGEVGPQLKSFAQAALHAETPFGVLVLASEDPQRFYPEMGVLYLARISDLVSAAILRCAHQK